MTVPLYWRDQSLMTWTATVLASSPEGVVLDESAFFPGGGGQPAVDEEIARDRSILDRVVTREEALADPDVMRTAQRLIPPDVRETRVIDVDGLDKQADGGTHVASTRQIGEVRIVKVENKGKGFRRVRISLPR